MNRNPHPNPTPIDALRRSARRRLPKLVRKAIADYVVFASQDMPVDAKGFAAHQAACKTALAHVEAGAKLLAWAENDGATNSGDQDLARMIEAAEHAIAVVDAEAQDT